MSGRHIAINTWLEALGLNHYLPLFSNYGGVEVSGVGSLSVTVCLSVCLSVCPGPQPLPASLQQLWRGGGEWCWFSVCHCLSVYLSALDLNHYLPLFSNYGGVEVSGVGSVCHCLSVCLSASLSVCLSLSLSQALASTTTCLSSATMEG